MNPSSFQVAAATDVGSQREINEDTYVCERDLGIFAVIDGVGGEAAGEVAAQTAKSILLGRLRRKSAPPPQRLREAVTLANNAIFERARDEPELRGMACVLTVAIFEAGTVTVGHVGDTRLYRLRKGRIDKTTRDHSPVGILEEAGELSEKAAMAHPRRSEILRDVGSEPLEPDSPDFVEIHQFQPSEDEALLWCSDGLTDQVPSADIRRLVETHAANPETAVRELIRAANAAGGRDNVTVVLAVGPRYPSASIGAAPIASVEANAPAPSPSHATGGSYARRSLGDRWTASLRRRAGWWIVAALALALAGWLAVHAETRRAWSELLGLPTGPRPSLLVGGDDGSFATIAEALAKARPGQVVEVSPGIYDEQIELRDGVTLVSREPQAAVLQPAAEGSLNPAFAVLAEGVRGARLEGFRILGGEDQGLEVGLRLVGSQVVVEDVEITGATRAGVEITGPDRSLLAYGWIHGNEGAGVLLRGPVATRLRHNLILDNGADTGVGVDLVDGASPAFRFNVFAGHGAAAIRGLPEGRQAEVRAGNELRGSGRAFAPAVDTRPSNAQEAEAGAVDGETTTGPGTAPDPDTPDDPPGANL